MTEKEMPDSAFALKDHGLQASETILTEGAKISEKRFEAHQDLNQRQTP